MVASEDCTCQLRLPVWFSWSVRLLLNYHFSMDSMSFLISITLFLTKLDKLLSHENLKKLTKPACCLSSISSRLKKKKVGLLSLAIKPRATSLSFDFVKTSRNYSYFSVLYVFSFHVHKRAGHQKTGKPAFIQTIASNNFVNRHPV